jgi:acyl-CoA thioester hydrolase
MIEAIDMAPRLTARPSSCRFASITKIRRAGGVPIFEFAERARTEMLRLLGIENSVLQDRHGLAFVVRHIEVEYLSPARLDDVVEVYLELTKVGGASLEGAQAIRKDGVDLVRMSIRLGCMKLAGGWPMPDIQTRSV